MDLKTTICETLRKAYRPLMFGEIVRRVNLPRDVVADTLRTMAQTETIIVLRGKVTHFSWKAGE